MRKIFISYGDDSFKKSLKRIGKEAKMLGLFDKIILYSPNDLPAYIKTSPLMAFNRGGGYWAWKPYLIWKTLQQYGNDSIVVYVDAGCTLHQSDDWKLYFENMNKYDTIVFKYRDDVDYPWFNAYHCNSIQIKDWTKKNTLLYFDNLFGNQQWRHFNKIWGGFIIVKSINNKLINQWLNITLLSPKLIIDPYGNELEDQYDFFVEHRHDQCILTPLSYYYEKTDSVVHIFDESAESALLIGNKDVAVLAERLRDDRVLKITLKTRTIYVIKVIIGEKLYKLLHG